jgi:hypothetical protein
MIFDSVGDSTYWGYGDGSAVFYATVDDSDVLITSVALRSDVGLIYDVVLTFAHCRDGRL